MAKLPLNNQGGRYKRIHNQADEVNREKQLLNAILDLDEALKKGKELFEDDEQMLEHINSILQIKAKLIKDKNKKKGDIDNA